MNNRLQKKCLVAATGFHLLLLTVLLFGSAFFSRNDERKDLQMLDVIPANVIDAAFVGGGKPDAKPPKAAPLQPETKPTPTPPTPPTPEIKPKPTPQPEQEIKPPKAAPESLDVKQSKVRKPQVSDKVVIRESGKPTTSKPNPNPDSKNRELAKNQEAVGSALRSLRDNLSSSTTVDIPGPGGEAYAGFENVIQSIYQSRYTQEISTGGEVADKRMEVGVSVTIRRDGTVISSRIIQPSANAALNKLVQRVLDKVTFIHEFPKGAKDQQRTFNIIFDLKPKKALG